MLAGMTPDTDVERGSAALRACDWEAARAAFERAVAVAPTPDALHGLGQALYWLADYPRALATLADAYAAHRREGSRRVAGRIATQLALLHGVIDGNGAAVSGWMRHAERALTDDPGCLEAGWLAVSRACFTSDPTERGRHAEDAIAIGRRFADPAVEFEGIAYLGKAHVERGRLRDGLELVDEALAAVASGLVDDPWATAEILCTMFHTCELAVDLRRAQDWLGAVDDHLERTGERPVYGICRMHYGGLLTAAGRWDDAERELRDALAIYDQGYRGSRAEAVLRLADLRARQGRSEEAWRLLDGYEDLPAAATTLARLHLADGAAPVARAALLRHLERRGRGCLAAPALALLVESELACGDLADAERGVEELSVLADAGDHVLVRGLAELSRARVAAATPADDAVAAYEAALAAFAEADLPCELAHAHLELAHVLADDEPEVARSEARAALACFDRVGARAGADAAAALLRRLGDRSRSWPRTPGELTARESEVLALVAEGRTNADIAERLHLSVRTVEHHVSSVLAKLGVTSRTEAAAHLLRSGSTARPH